MNLPDMSTIPEIMELRERALRDLYAATGIAEMGQDVRPSIYAAIENFHNKVCRQFLDALAQEDQG